MGAIGILADACCGNIGSILLLLGMTSPAWLCALAILTTKDNKNE